MNSRNIALGGGALNVDTNDTTVDSSMFNENVATDANGGALWGGGNTKVYNSTFYKNVARFGVCQDAPGLMINDN